MPELKKPRDHRIDFLRGLALVMIFINHIPGTFWENFTSRNFGFSDAAEGFVLMSGIATGLAFGPAYMAAAPMVARLRPWRRSLVLWAVHVPCCLLILALFAALIGDPAVAKMAAARNIAPVLQDPWSYVPSVTVLMHQFAYADILPLYILLLLAAPGVLLLAVRWPRALMLGSLIMWFAAGFWFIRLPTYPQPNAWFFNPFSWQVLFVAGVLTGLATRQGRRFLPYHKWAVVLAWGFLIMAAIWVQVPAVAKAGGHALWQLKQWFGLPSVLVAFDKGMLHLPRLLHILALAYALSYLPVLKPIASSGFGAVLARLGRHSLPVFATGTVLAYVGQLTKAMAGPSLLLDTLLIGLGLCVLFAVARLREGQKQSAAIARTA
ncbi:OpgC domain-containing protein [Xinfangfangia sp. CPCC 101601]|uniref:OpgC domain-containing protein n=1 Tax=Pseudogemmobacter lacusdianii TaxID=3069608 RepID=A0ABU0W1D2_9RHOB|nr:OpgC domain-containing protein [Xinfangfangia sp. CPCC 101601]MDQ2067827.1 OpgC domain-containing protein [Xinfangfangia sp. CPCC 101601]